MYVALHTSVLLILILLANSNTCPPILYFRMHSQLVELGVARNAESFTGRIHNYLQWSRSLILGFLGVGKYALWGVKICKGEEKGDLANNVVSRAIRIFRILIIFVWLAYLASYTSYRRSS